MMFYLSKQNSQPNGGNKRDHHNNHQLHPENPEGFKPVIGVQDNKIKKHYPQDIRQAALINYKLFVRRADSSHTRDRNGAADHAKGDRIYQATMERKTTQVLEQEAQHKRNDKHRDQCPKERFSDQADLRLIQVQFQRSFEHDEYQPERTQYW